MPFAIQLLGDLRSHFKVLRFIAPRFQKQNKNKAHVFPLNMHIKAKYANS